MGMPFACLTLTPFWKNGLFDLKLVIINNFFKKKIIINKQKKNQRNFETCLTYQIIKMDNN